MRMILISFVAVIFLRETRLMCIFQRLQADLILSSEELKFSSRISDDTLSNIFSS